MEKLTDAEIKKALDNCLRGDCSWCVRKRQGVGLVTCRKEMRKYAHDLINRKDAEIERLKKSRDDLYEEMSERQKEEVKIARKMGKSEAYKEFAERLHQNCKKYPYTLPSVLTNIEITYKELTEGCK